MRTNRWIAVVLLAQGLAGCGDVSSHTPSVPSSVTPPPSPRSGVNGVVYRTTPAGRTPLEGASVTLVVQVQTGALSGYTYPVYGNHTSSMGEFQFDSVPNGANIFAYATYSG